MFPSVTVWRRPLFVKERWAFRIRQCNVKKKSGHIWVNQIAKTGSALVRTALRETTNVTQSSQSQLTSTRTHARTHALHPLSSEGLGVYWLCHL